MLGIFRKCKHLFVFYYILVHLIFVAQATTSNCNKSLFVQILT